MWDVILPVIVGGLIGVFGALGGPPLTHMLNAKHERAARRRAKAEEISSHLYEHDHWLDLVRSYRVFGREEVSSPPPMSKARAAQRIHLPELTADLDEVFVAAKDYEIWMINAQQKRLEGAPINEVTAGYKDVCDPYVDKLDKFVRKLGEVVSSAK